MNGRSAEILSGEAIADGAKGRQHLQAERRTVGGAVRQGPGWRANEIRVRVWPDVPRGERETSGGPLPMAAGKAGSGAEQSHGGNGRQTMAGV